MHNVVFSTFEKVASTVNFKQPHTYLPTKVMIQALISLSYLHFKVSIDA